jgi:excisionase family DNA binding protein
MIPKLLTVEDISALLGIGKATTYQLVRKMKHVKVGRRILVSETDLMEYLEANAHTTTNESAS